MVSFVVTGASRGLGLEYVKQLSARGDTVFACARNPDQSQALTQIVDNQKVFAVKLDVTCEKSIKEAADEISKHAPEGVDVLVNNAGITGTEDNIEKVSKDELHQIFETNVVAVNEVTKGFLPLLRKRGNERVKKIVNMSSILGSIKGAGSPGLAFFNSIASYRVSKTALNMVTKLQSIHLAKENFIVYSIHPGWCQTDMGGEQAPLTTEESIRGQLVKIDSITASDNGGFFDWSGDVIEH
ncbi:unnamed protein product [Rhizopus stolonifer]